MENKLKSITIADNEPYLRQISVDVNIAIDNDLKNDIEVLEQYCKENEVMAMAAVQLGIPKRLLYLKNTNLDIINKIQTDSTTDEEQNYNEARVLINPVIIRREGLTEYWEACASCLDNCGRVLRPYKIDLEYYDIEGNKHSETFEGFESTVLSHEMDHLDGILHIDIAEEVLLLSRNERKVWRQSHGYKIYSEVGKYELLKEEQSKNKILKK
mgnify:CR=1 FL=1